MEEIGEERMGGAALTTGNCSSKTAGWDGESPVHGAVTCPAKEPGPNRAQRPAPHLRGNNGGAALSLRHRLVPEQIFCKALGRLDASGAGRVKYLGIHGVGVGRIECS
jgi:hypothetical protein